MLYWFLMISNFIIACLKYQLIISLVISSGFFSFLSFTYMYTCTSHAITSKAWVFFFLQEHCNLSVLSTQVLANFHCWDSTSWCVNLSSVWQIMGSLLWDNSVLQCSVWPDGTWPIGKLLAGWTNMVWGSVTIYDQAVLYSGKSVQPVLHDWCSKGRGMCYPVFGMVHIKEPLMVIKKSILVAAAGFLSRYLSGPLPYVWRHITVNKMCWVRR